MKLNPRNKRSAVSALRLALILTIATLLPLLLYGSSPSWWSQRGVLVQNGPVDDFAPANHGQLKNIARAAVEEMDAKLSGGAGDTLHQLVASWASPALQRNDFAPLNLGQLKNVAKPFYDRLITAGLRTQYPWTSAGTQADDYSVASIGQVKNLFSFELPDIDPLYDGDQNGLPDAWEQHYFGTTGVDPGADADGDGVNNLQEYLHHTDPTDYFNGTLKSLSVTGGGDQRGAPGSLLPVPVFIRVSTVDSDGVMNAPVTVMIAQGGARVRTATGVPATELTVRATAFDNDGYPVAQVYVLLPPTPDVSVIRASSSGGVRSVSVITTAVAIDASLVAPRNLVVTPTSGSSARLTWDPASNTSATTVQVSVDGGRTWITLGTVAPGVREATVTGLKPDQTVSFRLFSGGTPSANSSSFAFPDPWSGPPPAPPPGPGGGAATQPVDAVPLGAPVMEIETQSVSRGKFGFRGLLNQGGPYRDKTLVITSNYTNSDGTPDPSTGTTTVRQHWQRINNGDTASQVNTTEVIGGGGFLNPPLTTVTNTDTVFRQEGAPLPGYSGGSSRTITLSDLYTDEQLNAEGAALVPSFNDDFWPAEDDAYADFRKTSLVYEVTFLQYRFKVNADPNLVVTWDVQFTPEDGGPVQHDIQSWASQGSVQSPTYLLDPRTLNGGKTGTYLVTLLSVELMVDANRDGEMSFTNPAAHDADQTSEDRPYRFWVNDDDDGAAGDPGEHVPVSSPDYADGVIRSTRDLEDFARLHVNMTGLEEALESGTVKAAFEWRQTSDSPRIKLYRANSAGTDYLTNESKATLSMLSPFRDTLGEIVPGTPLFLPDGFWISTPFASNVPTTLPFAWFLFEGSGEGTGQLVLSFWKEGRKIGETAGVSIELKNIKTMYQRAIATPETLLAPYESNGIFDDDSVSYMPDVTPRFEQPAEETPQCLIFVHGWKATETDAANVGQTMYKRLWWQGFKGRFVTFRWPTYTSVLSYNSSEWRAWKYGKSLCNYVTNYVRQQLPSYAISIAAHSMGNVVTGSALRRGMRIDNYFMMQAAIPAGCYNDSVNNYARFLIAESSRPTPDSTSEMGYRLLLQSAGQNVGHFVSFFNLNDYALATGLIALPGWPFETNWEKNEEDYKPDAGGGGVYVYQGNGISYFIRPHSDVRQVIDLHESLAFVARPRSKAAGAETHNATVFGSVVNLEATCNFGPGVADHSGQFERPIQQLAPFYKRMIDELK